MWDLIVSVPDHCLSFYFTYNFRRVCKRFSHILILLNESFLIIKCLSETTVKRQFVIPNSTRFPTVISDTHFKSIHCSSNVETGYCKTNSH